MNEKKNQTRLATACATANVLLDSVYKINSALDNCDAKNAQEVAGSILSEVVNLGGLATLLLLDIDSLIKSCEEK